MIESWIIIALFILGALCASFTGVVAERLHTGQSWVRGRSRCNSCGAHLDARDLLPIVSWLAHAGKCRQCRARVPGAYALAEFSLGVSFVAAYHLLGLTPVLPLFFAALVILLFIVLYDLRHTIVPQGGSTLLLIASLSVALLREPSPQALGLILITSGIIALFFFLLHACSGGRAMGLGDAPVALALSLLAGTQAVPGLLFSFWIGALYGIILLCVRRGGPRLGIELPFVPFMALGFLLALFTGWNPLAFVL